MNPTIRAVARFWWVALIGLVVAALAATQVVYRMELSWPPKLHPRTQATYTGATQLFVNSASNPYLRTTETRVVTEPTPGAAKGNSKNPTQPVVSIEDPSTAAIIDAANLLPFFVESDEVSQIREREYGVLPGSVSARALFAVTTPRGLQPSRLPVIQIEAVARTPDQALRLVSATADAFTTWLVGKQDEAKVPRSERILLEQLRAPQAVKNPGRDAYGVALVVFAGILGMFVVLITALHRLFAPLAPLAAPAAPVPAVALSTNGNPQAEASVETELDQLLVQVEERLLQIIEKPPDQRALPSESARESTG